jgi:hypothetical protein
MASTMPSWICMPAYPMGRGRTDPIEEGVRADKTPENAPE